MANSKITVDIELTGEGYKAIKEVQTRIDKMARGLVAYQRSRSGLAGQAFTGWECLRCGAEHTHPNTMVPFICDECIGDLKKKFEAGEL